MKVIQINHQPISKRDLHPDGVLQVHSVFHTLQGEGPFTGVPAVFVRLKGCNLQCPGCDTEYTETREEGGTLSKTDVAARVAALTGFPNPSTKLVVISGGEPFRQNIVPLVKYLVHTGYTVQIETNGTLPPPIGLFANPIARCGHTPLPRSPYNMHVYVVVSPKTGKVHPHTEKLACAYKYVLHKDSVDELDGLPTLALGHSAAPRVARPPTGWRGPVYLQPMDVQEDEANQLNVQACVDSCLKHGYTLQLQTHKYLGVE